MVDLGNWASERYRIDGDPIGPDDDEGESSD